jgi:hypothetical protein
MDARALQEESQNLQNPKNDDFEIFELDMIDRPCLQHDQ